MPFLPYEQTQYVQDFDCSLLGGREPPADADGAADGGADAAAAAMNGSGGPRLTARRRPFVSAFPADLHAELGAAVGRALGVAAISEHVSPANILP